MAKAMDGVITIVQEGRFQMTDDAGVSHLFILGHAAAAETEQLDAIRRGTARVRVRFEEPGNLIGNVATRIIRIS